MEWKRIVAIVRKTALDQVEERLKELGVKGVSMTPIKGYGEYANFYKADWSVSNVRLELYLPRQYVDPVVQGILDTAHSGSPGDGLVAVLPVETIYRIRTKAEMRYEET